MDDDERGILESGTLTQPDTMWAEARRRAAIIGPLAEREKTPSSLAAEAGEQLGLSARTIYTHILPETSHRRTSFGHIRCNHPLFCSDVLEARPLAA